MKKRRLHKISAEGAVIATVIPLPGNRVAIKSSPLSHLKAQAACLKIPASNLESDPHVDRRWRLTAKRIKAHNVYVLAPPITSRLPQKMIVLPQKQKASFVKLEGSHSCEQDLSHLGTHLGPRSRRKLKVPRNIKCADII